MISLNPLVTVLTAMITPAVLISACGTLIISTGNRLGRVVDQVRAVTARYKSLLDEDKGELYAEQERQLILRLIPQISRRAQLLHRSLTAFYTSVGLFVLTSVMIGLGAAGDELSGLNSVTRWVSTQLPLLLGIAGVGALSYGSTLLIVEARLAYLTTQTETRFLHDLVTQHDPLRSAGTSHGG